jgi:hypothetical protein
MCLLVGLTGNYHWCANETCLKSDLNPSALFHQTNLTLPPFDPQSPEVLDRVPKPVMSALICAWQLQRRGL